MKVLFWEGEDSHDLKHLLRSTGPCEVFAAVVGPEGGFRVEEVEEARAAGFAPVSLGRRVLRAETAAITAAAIVQYEWGDLSLAGAES
jgi:16S rRNA (uracil1498-N3)-methyltransferase